MNRFHLRSLLKGAFVLTFLAASLTQGFSASLFGPRLRWAPTNFVARDITTLAILVEHSATQNRGNVDTLRAVASTIEQEFTEACHNKGYQLVSRSMIQKCEKELELRRLRITDREGAALAGRVLNTSHLLIVTDDVHTRRMNRKNFVNGRMEIVHEVSARLNCQIIVTQSALEFAACSDNITTEGNSTGELIPTVARVAKRIAAALPARPSSTIPVTNPSR